MFSKAAINIYNILKVSAPIGSLLLAAVNKEVFPAFSMKYVD
jgi:hypothetical protein